MKKKTTSQKTKKAKKFMLNKEKLAAPKSTKISKTNYSMTQGASKMTTKMKHTSSAQALADKTPHCLTSFLKTSLSTFAMEHGFGDYLEHHLEPKDPNQTKAAGDQQTFTQMCGDKSRRVLPTEKFPQG